MVNDTDNNDVNAIPELPDWPPSVTPSRLAYLTSLSRDYALSHSIVYRPLLSSSSSTPSGGDFSTSVIHAPFALFPTPFPRPLFRLAQNVQKAYNALYACIAADFDFLEKVVGGNVARVDEFQGELWRIAREVRQEGIAQPIALGLFRSDYLLHQNTSTHELQASSSRSTTNMKIKQVEFNTISSSFGALSTQVSEMHRALAKPLLRDIAGELPENEASEGLAGGLEAAWKAYSNPQATTANSQESERLEHAVLFVVQENERNAFDQRLLEWRLVARGIPVVRRTFPELGQTAYLDPSDRTLLIRQADPAPPVRVSVVYYRAGYGPSDYPGAEAWDVRHLLERSAAIKCPSVALQLAGAKKVQQVLSDSAVLDSLIQKHAALREYGKDAWAQVRETFMGLYPLDESPAGQQALQVAYKNPERFVLKPQREGGGNNVYRGDIPGFLNALEEKDKQSSSLEGGLKRREGYILMELILPPEKAQNLLVRAGDPEPKLGQVVSELGIYGVTLFRDTQDGTCEIIRNERAGHLLRTKGRESDEGGVAVGFSVIDSPLLV